MRITTARRFLFGNWTDVVRRAVGKTSPAASVESDAVKSPPDAVDPIPEAVEPLSDTLKPSPEAVNLAVELPSDVVKTPVYSVQETTAEKRVKEFFRNSRVRRTAMIYLDWASQMPIRRDKEQIKSKITRYEEECKWATGSDFYVYKHRLSDLRQSVARSRLVKLFDKNNMFFRHLALFLFYSPDTRLQALAAYTQSLGFDTWYDLRCAICLQKARVGRLNPSSKYELTRALYNPFWRWLALREDCFTELEIMIKWPLRHTSTNLIQHLQNYQYEWKKFLSRHKRMHFDFENILARRMRTSVRQAVFNAHFNLYRCLCVYNDTLWSMRSVLNENRVNSFSYVQIRDETRGLWTSLISQTCERMTGFKRLYKEEFIPILTRRLELMSPAELHRHSVLARRYWVRHWQRQSESDKIITRFEDLSTMTHQKLQEIRQARKGNRRARWAQRRKEYWEAKHAGPSFKLEPSTRDQIGSKVKESDDNMPKPETVQWNIGRGDSENTASTLVRKYHVGSYGDNVPPTTASENTTPQSAPPRIYPGTLTFRPSQNSFDRSLLKRLYNEIPTKQAVEKPRSPYEIETEKKLESSDAYKKKVRGPKYANIEEILDAGKKNVRGPKHTSIEMRQNDREWNTPHGTVKHNERSDVDKMVQDWMRHSHDRGIGKPDDEPSQSRIIEILRHLEVPEAYIDKARAMLKNSSSSKGPQHRKPRSSFTAEEFSRSSHSPEVFQKESVRLHDRTSVDQADPTQSSNSMHGWYSPSKPVKRGERQFRSSKIFGEPFKDLGSLGTHEPGIEMLNSKTTAREGDDSTFMYTPPHKNTTKTTTRHGAFDRPIWHPNKNYESTQPDATSQYNHRGAPEWRSSSEADTRYTKRSDQDGHGLDSFLRSLTDGQERARYTKRSGQDSYVIADYIRSFLEGYEAAQKHKAAPLFTKEEEPIREIRQTYKYGAHAPGSGYSTRYQGKRVSNGRNTPRYNKMRRTGPPIKGSYNWHNVNEPKPWKPMFESRVFPAETLTATESPSKPAYPWFHSTKSGGD